MHAVTTTDPGEFLDGAREFLLSDPVLNSVLLSVATARAEAEDGPESGKPPGSWALLCDGDAPVGDSTASAAPAVLGAAMRLPPHGVVISRLPAGGADVLADALIPICADAPTVAGPTPDIEEFVEAWLARTGRRALVGMAQRIHRLDRVFPVHSVPGTHRPPRADELDLLAGWLVEFHHEIEDPGAPPPTVEQARDELERRLAAGTSYVWDDGGPVSFVGTRPRIGGVVRIGPVYTPAASRAHGYASALTAAVSQDALRAGADSCALYTDLGNRTSNQIYAAVGYRPVCDARTYTLHDGGN